MITSKGTRGNFRKSDSIESHILPRKTDTRNCQKRFSHIGSGRYTLYSLDTWNHCNQLASRPTPQNSRTCDFKRQQYSENYFQKIFMFNALCIFFYSRYLLKDSFWSINLYILTFYLFIFSIDEQHTNWWLNIIGCKKPSYKLRQYRRKYIFVTN